MDREPSSERESGYERFFGFHRTPFSLAPDTRFRFQSASHAAALTQVTYALERREPAVVVTGDIGTGKTLLCRTVVEQLQRRTFLSIVNDPLLGHDELLTQLLQDFGVVSRHRTKSTPTTRHDLIHALQEFLSSLTSLRAHAVVIIDEAQHLQPAVLEHVRLVSNIHDERGAMLQIILVGQTDLDQLLSRPELRALKQRVSRSVRLEPLTAAEVAHYIGHRLTIARAQQPQSNIPNARKLERELAEWNQSKTDATFTPEAVQAVARLSRGIPRVANLLCDRALEAAYAREQRTVDASLIGTAAQALALPDAPKAASSPPQVSSESLVWPQLAPTAVPVLSAPLSTRDAVGPSRYVIVAALLVLVGAAIWFGGRAMNRSGTGERASPAAAATQPTTTPEPVPPVAAPPNEIATPPPPAEATPTAPQVPQPTGTAAESTGEAFEIVVASFHTASRANSVATAVAALDQPVRQRTAGGWEQVLAGPYASAALARDAQQRLERAGFTGTQLVPAAR